MEPKLLAFDLFKHYYFSIEDEPEQTQFMMLSAEAGTLSLSVYDQEAFYEVTVLYHSSLLQDWLTQFEETVRLRTLSLHLAKLAVLDEAQ
ncbi:hypothetical protein [Bacillus sp. FJAT-42376]|uniref:hypothetical protein n=1 Tax=Bacillus sp. FJAT-42376 TaxID=2014076 RepID=UPI000F4F97D3|nr:hypothetical protein [Bacillus sp. FJAT-42376]